MALTIVLTIVAVVGVLAAFAFYELGKRTAADRETLADLTAQRTAERFADELRR